MKAVKAAAVIGGVFVAMAVPATSALASAPANGATLSFSQFGNTTHRICVNAPFELDATGFAPNRHSVTAQIVGVGEGAFFPETVMLSGGSGSAEMPPGAEDNVGLKIRARYQTGSTNHVSNLGSASGTFVNCF